MEHQHGQFDVASRMVHWILSAMALTMLFVGVAMISSLTNNHLFLPFHRSLDVTIMTLSHRLIGPGYCRGGLVITAPNFPAKKVIQNLYTYSTHRLASGATVAPVELATTIFERQIPQEALWQV